MIPESITSLYLPYPGRDDRLVRVWVPERREDEALPVVYMTDGQNLFDEESSTFGCWHIREAVRSERARSGKAAIIVGIHNTDPYRTSELAPKCIGPLTIPEEARHLVAPEGEVFDEFIVNTVMPAVQARFPVKTGRENTAFCGSSMGGLMAFFTALCHPDLYSIAGVFSPAFVLYRPQDLKRWIPAQIGQSFPFLYVYSGGGEPMEKDILSSTEWVWKILSDCYPSAQRKKVIHPDCRHHESAWEPVFIDFLQMFLS